MMIMKKIKMKLIMNTVLHHNLLGSRHYSKVIENQPLLYDLFDRINSLYLNHQPTVFNRLYEEDCEELEDGIVSLDYQLSPLIITNIRVDDDFVSYSHRKTVLCSAYCGLLRYYPYEKEGYVTLVRPSSELDVLLITALEQVLLEYTVNWKCPRIENLIYDFHSDINKGMVCVNRIYRLEIDYPPDIGLFLRRLSINLTPDTHLYHYITSFQNLSYIDEDGKCLDSLNGVYSVGDLSKIVLNLVLKEIFDYEFRKLFPGVVFTRFVSQVIIGTKDSDEVNFNEEAGYALLKSLGLSGQIVSIGRGDDPIPICGGRLLYVESIL